eukprot:CAMPEP_0170057384 /NCGR_PEP_ID=MMETSP0019_2-20121128/408_1 /TAXON_ID=98059 /ORGANISM="Dinobryon sp., Strain UTEXLB2267" /LENGTH=439 /DNA_ID=CAMNT_0010262073 /DNA_START=1243 /DNA_END=2562 /DNA_ORIENTATION=-
MRQMRIEFSPRESIKLTIENLRMNKHIQLVKTFIRSLWNHRIDAFGISIPVALVALIISATTIFLRSLRSQSKSPSLSNEIQLPINAEVKPSVFVENNVEDIPDEVDEIDPIIIDKKMSNRRTYSYFNETYIRLDAQRKVPLMEVPKPNIDKSAAKSIIDISAVKPIIDKSSSKPIIDKSAAFEQMLQRAKPKVPQKWTPNVMITPVSTTSEADIKTDSIINNNMNQIVASDDSQQTIEDVVEEEEEVVEEVVSPPPALAVPVSAVDAQPVNPNTELMSLQMAKKIKEAEIAEDIGAASALLAGLVISTLLGPTVGFALAATSGMIKKRADETAPDGSKRVIRTLGKAVIETAKLVDRVNSDYNVGSNLDKLVTTGVSTFLGSNSEQQMRQLQQREDYEVEQRMSALLPSTTSIATEEWEPAMDEQTGGGYFEYNRLLK